MSDQPDLTGAAAYREDQDPPAAGGGTWFVLMDGSVAYRRPPHQDGEWEHPGIISVSMLRRRPFVQVDPGSDP